LAPPSQVILKSVGVDIGSSTSHFTISRLVLEKSDDSPKTKYEVIEREIIFESEIILTPYIDENTIDVDALETFFRSNYETLHMTKEDIQTGAVITTGEATKKQNAERITQTFSKLMGNFVSATAGHHLEAMLAAHGSGAVTRSKALHSHDEHKDQEPMTVMDVDIGGGTSKMAIVHNGTILHTAAINIGARLIAYDEQDIIVRIEGPMIVLAREAGIELKIGDTLTLEHKQKLSHLLANCLMDFMLMKLTSFSRRFMVTEPIHFTEHIDEVLFSGGVSEYIYRKKKENVGDLGTFLADEIRDRIKDSILGSKLAEPDATIRATVVGAAQYTLQISGSTIFIAQSDMLPLRNVPVISPHIGELSVLAVKSSVLKALSILDPEGRSAIALSLDVGPIGHDGLSTLTEGIRVALASLSKQVPIVLVFKENVGRQAGILLREKIGNSYPLASIDEVELGDFDYIDVGAMTAQEFVPVVVKSLIFHSGKGPDIHDQGDHEHGHTHEHGDNEDTHKSP